MSALLVAQDLSRQFGGLLAVSGLSFEVREGEVLGLIGPNGAGKSTTFNVISGFYRPTSGRLSFRGEDITGMSASAISAAGASGFVVKDTPARQLADAVRRVAAGLRVVDPTLAAETLARGASPLTQRETDVLRAASDGGTVADIAAELALSEGTVRNHLSAAIGKTGARTRAEAVRLADEHGWLLPS